MISPREYLFNKERTYPVAEFVNNNLAEESILIMVGEPRGFYFDRKVVLYSIWNKRTSEDIASYINRLKKNLVPVYLLYRGDADCDEVSRLIKDKRPIYRIKREIDQGKQADYYVFKL